MTGPERHRLSSSVTGLWATRLGGRPDVVGQFLTLDNISYSVIGVLPATFDFFERRVDAYAPVGLHGAEPEWLRRGNHPIFSVWRVFGPASR